MPGIMDRALEGSSCPFTFYQESLQAFARAIYVLRLEGGRCTEPGFPAGCGFYDPKNLYHNPSVSTINYRGDEVTYSAADQPHPSGIPSSFGTDLVEVALDEATKGQPLTIELYGAPGSGAAFNVQLLKLTSQPMASEVAALEPVRRVDPDGQSAYVIPELDTAEYSRLGLIITRVDASESSDPSGAYTIVVHP
jgi:hypothetical protein